MAWQRSQDVPGPLLSSPPPCWLISSGGALTIILYVLMPRCGCRSCSLANEGARRWHNGTGSGPQPWRRGEPPDDGRRGKFCLIPYRRCLASECEHERCEKTPWERARGGLGKVKTGTVLATSDIRSKKGCS